MKVLTIQQPYASLIKEGIKKVEIRTWKTKYRGELYIHAGVAKNIKIINKYKNVIDINSLEFGYIICKCNIIDCIKLDKEIIDDINKKYSYLGYNVDYQSIGCYGFMIDNVEKLDIPIKAKGKLSFWQYNSN